MAASRSASLPICRMTISLRCIFHCFERVVHDEVSGSPESGDGQFLTLDGLRAFDAGPGGDGEGHDIGDAADHHEVFVPLDRCGGDNRGADHADLALAGDEVLNNWSGSSHMNCLNVQAFVRKVVCILRQPEAQEVCVDAGIEDVYGFLLGGNRTWLCADEYEKIQNPGEENPSIHNTLTKSQRLLKILPHFTPFYLHRRGGDNLIQTEAILIFEIPQRVWPILGSMHI